MKKSKKGKKQVNDKNYDIKILNESIEQVEGTYIKANNDNIVWGYARCSTDETKQDIDRQIRELEQLNADIVILEYEHADGRYRQGLDTLLNYVNDMDIITTTEVSRITRSTKQLCEIIEITQAKKLKLDINGFIVDCRKGELDPMTEGMLKMMGVFAEMERKMISQRVKSGLANASNKGKVIGRPKLTFDNVPDVVIRHYNKYNMYRNATTKEQKANGINMSEYARLCDCSRQMMYKYIEVLDDYYKGV